MALDNDEEREPHIVAGCWVEGGGGQIEETGTECSGGCEAEVKTARKSRGRGVGCALSGLRAA